MKKWKEVLEKNYKIVQACGCICLIGVLGFGIYSLQKESIPAKETEVVVTEKKQEKSTTQKTEKKDTDQSKKQEIKSATAEIKKVEKETGKNPVKKADTSSGQKAEKKEEKKSNTEKSESSKEQKPQEQSAPTSQPSKPEQKPQQSPAPAPQQPSQPEQKPSQPTQKPSQPTPAPQQPQQPSQPEQKPQECVHNWVYHPEQGHENTYTVIEEVYEPWDCCNVCGADCTADPSSHMKEHALAGEGGGWHTEYFKTKEVTKTEWVVDVPAYTECSGCGARQ